MLFDDAALDLGPRHPRRVPAPCAAARRFVFQSYNLFANKTALQNVTEGLIIAPQNAAPPGQEIARAALVKVGTG